MVTCSEVSIVSSVLTSVLLHVKDLRLSESEIQVKPKSKQWKCWSTQRPRWGKTEDSAEINQKTLLLWECLCERH